MTMTRGYGRETPEPGTRDAPPAPARESAGVRAWRPEAILALQRTAGNAAVTRLLQREPAAPGAVDADSIVEDYPIRPGSEDALDRHVWRRDTSRGDVASHEVYDEGVRRLTKDGLREHLASLQNGRLGPFDEQLISTWGDDEHVQLTPVLRIGESGVFAYLLDTGSTGDKVRTVYARGTVVTQRHSETPLVNMGLGPFEWVLLASAALAVGRLAIRYAGTRMAAADVVADARIYLPPNKPVFAVIQDGQIIARSYNSSLSHEVFLERAMRRTTRWTKDTLPPGVEVVSIVKDISGDLGTLLSRGIHGASLPASAAAQAAARAAYR